MSEPTKFELHMAPVVMLDAFSDVPRAFWSGMPVAAIRGVLASKGRLTLPERDLLWELLGRAFEDAPRLRIVFDPERMGRVVADTPPGETPDAFAERLLAALSGRGHSYA